MTNEQRSKIDEHLAWCIATIRAQHVPTTPWDRAGITAAMREVQHRNPAEVFTAAYQLATNPAIDTPRVLTLDGPHWHTQPATTPSTNTASSNPADDPRCDDCYKHRSVHDQVMQRWPQADRHEFAAPRRTRQ